MGGWSEEKKMAKAKSPRAVIEREKNKHWVVCSPTGEAVVDGVDGQLWQDVTHSGGTRQSVTTEE